MNGVDELRKARTERVRTIAVMAAALLPDVCRKNMVAQGFANPENQDRAIEVAEALYRRVESLAPRIYDDMGG